VSKNIEAIVNNYNRRRALDDRFVAYDIVFIININSKGWILDKICKIIEHYSGLNCYFLYSERNDRLTLPLPKARAYFFAHFALAFWTMVKYPEVFSSGLFFYFTHFDANKGITRAELTACMNHCDHVIAMNSAHRRALLSLGVDEDRISTILAGVDPDMFTSHPRRGETVGFVGAYYERKQPERMYDLIKSMPDIKFLLVAPGPSDVNNEGLLWRNWKGFSALKELRNFTYIEAPYEDYNLYYGQMDAYVSLSSLEGGPIPVAEAMMANVIPIASRTGFAEDVFVGALEQYIVEIDEPIESVVRKVRTALEDTTTNVRPFADNITWKAFAERVLEKMLPAMKRNVADRDISLGETVYFSDNARGHQILQSGWDKVYAEGVGTSSDLASLCFGLEKNEAGPHRILLDVSAASKNDAVILPLSVRIEQNELLGNVAVGSNRETHVAYFDLDSNKPVHTLEFSIQRGEGAEQEPASLVLHSLRVDNGACTWTGNRLNFGADYNNAGLTYNSWHSSEIDGVWTDGPVGSVSFQMPDENEGRRLSFNVEGRVLGAAEALGKALEITVSRGGKSKTKTFQKSSDLFTTMKVEGPADIALRGPVTITFKRLIAPCPYQLDANVPDMRNLGFFLKAITVL